MPSIQNSDLSPADLHRRGIEPVGSIRRAALSDVYRDGCGGISDRNKSAAYGDLNVGEDVGVTAFFVAGVYSRSRIAVVHAIGDGSVYISGNRVQRSIDL
jgi:hypothetical protein